MFNRLFAEGNFHESDESASDETDLHKPQLDEAGADQHCVCILYWWYPHTLTTACTIICVAYAQPSNVPTRCITISNFIFS